MDAKQFKKLFDNFTPTKRSFSVADGQKHLDIWKSYYDDIIQPSGLPIDRWVKNTAGYLPDFLGNVEKLYGGARIGNFDQVMIYQYTGKDNDKKDKFWDKYKWDKYKKEKDLWCDKISGVESDYNEKIKPLLTDIVNATTTAKVYEVENNELYNKFSNKQILRKMTILMSVLDNAHCPNEFMWIYNDGSLYNLSKILEMDIDPKKTFLENNHDIYERAKSFAGITATSTAEDYIRLYDFLWYLGDPNSNTVELSDFNSINIIFNGAPGTGKTYGVKDCIHKLHSIDSDRYRDYKDIQFHPAYTYQDFIEGIKPFGISGGNLDLQVVNGSFKQFCIYVKKENEKYYDSLAAADKPDVNKPSSFADWPHYYFVVDEINRGNLSNIFGETFTYLESDYRDYNFSGSATGYTDKTNLFTTPLSGVIARLKDNSDLIYKRVGNEICFGIPFNIHFVGMMNDVDRSIDAFDLALRRRFKWISKYCDYDVISDVLIDAGFAKDSIDEYVESCKALNAYICDGTVKEGLKLGRSYEIGHAFFLKIRNISTRKQLTKGNKKEVFENYIEGTLREYIRQVSDEGQIDKAISDAKEAFGVK